jgi:hypothetical protein
MSGCCWSCFSKKSILVRPTRPRPSQIELFLTLTHHNTTSYSHSHVIWMGLKPSFLFSQHLSASTSKFHRIWLHLKWWVKNRGAAFNFTSIRPARLIFSSLCSTRWSANFWNGCYMVRTRFRLVVSEFCYQHFREFHQESVENRRWYPHFHCWGTHPGL